MDSTTISKARPLYKSMDYHFLREEGIKHIQKLAGSLWTDYNSHDPGITLLEVLCYAITDLGYRSNLPIEDLLADSQAQEGDKHFFGITEILPCNPVTLTDLRKLIIDQEGIRNAWLKEITTASVRGLYDITLELEEHEEYGNLNFNLLRSSVTVDADPAIAGDETYEFEVAFPFWDELSWLEEDQEITGIFFAQDEMGDDIFIPIQDGGNTEANDYYAELELEIDNDNANLRLLPISIKVISEVSESIIDNISFQDAIKNELVNGTLVYEYWNKTQLATAIRGQVHKYRALCEDFQVFRAARIQEISISADVDLTPGARVEEVLGEIWYRIHAFLSPRPRFYTLQELLDKGQSMEDIFDGPLLTHGFLDTEELEAIKQQDVIYTSDLQQLLTDIPGLIAVRDLRIANYYNNDVLEQNAANCLKLVSPDLYKPLLSPDKSQIRFYKDRLPVTADEVTALSHFDALKSQARQEKKANVYELTPPQGENREVTSYFSIQHHFPPVYGIGGEELPPSVPDSRKAKAMQLSGYLLFFEQLLANYLSQLANVKSLFSMDSLAGSYSTTYFSQSLMNTIPAAEDLLNVSYEGNLSAMTEPPGTEGEPGVFHERRNRFLNHLMARFSESFGDYALFLYTAIENTETAYQNLIADKVTFLQEYPVLSGDRSRAFNYLGQRPDEVDPEMLVPDVWDTLNVSGFKKRIVRLLGLESYERRHIFDENPFSYYFSLTENAGDWSFALNTGNIADPSHTLESVITNYTDTEVETEAFRTAVLATQRTQYRLTGNVNNANLSFELLDDNGLVIAHTTAEYAAEADRDNHIQGIIDFLSIEAGNFHMLEHLLLRNYPVTLNIPSEVEGVFLTDPYSFRISFILPMQHIKLGDPGFRQYTESVIRSETPAHIVPHIYWVNATQMNEFEGLYETWLEARISGTTNDINAGRDALTDFLNTLALDS